MEPHSTEATPHQVSAQRRASARLATQVRVGLLALCAVLALSDAVVYLWEAEGQVASVDLAGRQRMLSQRVARFANALAADPDGVDAAEERLHLIEAARDMADGHAVLVASEAYGADAALRGLYEGDGGISAELARYIDSAEALAHLPSYQVVPDHPAVVQIGAMADGLLQDLDAATQGFERVASVQSQLTGWLTQAFTVLELAAVAGAWWFLFRPLVLLLREESAALEQWEVRNDKDREDRAFESSLSRALDMARTEGQVLEVASRALALVDTERPSEMLLADNSRAHLRVGAVDAALGRAGCDAATPYDCPAMRQGRTLRFESSNALDACPHLRSRGRACSGTCTPVTFMGQALGVLHQVGDDGTLLSKQRTRRLSTLAASIGTRLGTVQSFAKVEQQASTDPLTGLMNRRAFEDRMRALTVSGLPYALCVADLDKFKTLNDTYGHDAGDRALRTFSKVAQATCRSDDILCRWGGEEFVFVWPGATIEVARRALERLRRELVRVNESQPEHPSFTGSFGLADHRSGDGWREVLTAADEALLKAKDDGRDRVVLSALEGGREQDEDGSERSAPDVQVVRGDGDTEAA